MTKTKYLCLLRNTKLNQIPFLEKSNFVIVADLCKFGIKNLKGGHSRRPEIAGVLKYGERDVLKYINNTRNATIQRDMTECALNFLECKPFKLKSELFLDIGCGCGVSSKIIEAKGHICLGVDISSQLSEYAKFNCWASDVIQLDASKGLCFKNSTFPYAVSISVLQWFLKENSLMKLFCSLHNVLNEEGQGVFQFYPRNIHDLELILNVAEKYFYGCVLSDYPSVNRGIKIFLYLRKSVV